ncbi:hypothetical protein [Gymnodinialimonas hymeniacidonis]|uniref:hypothetical protein n=1 Tax=Gymnodinialimonas hymeniacidonis TaxID=3126508 RepID=UPI0034C6DB69
MTVTYRIEGPGDPDAMAQASAAAETIMLERANAAANSAFLGWLVYLLAAGCCAGLMFLWLFPLLQAADFAPQFAAFVPILTGIVAFVVVYAWLNAANTRRFWRAYCTDSMQASAHVLISEDSVRVVAGQTQTSLAWADIDRIDVHPAFILVMAGFAWTSIPLSGFASMEEAKEALANMRAWQAAAQE